MALDFALLDELGSPSESVSLSIKTHRQLMLDAENFGIRSYARFLDYYSDGSILSTELSEFRRGGIVIRQSSKSDAVKAFLAELIKLFDLASNKRQAIQIIAD